MKDWKDIPGFEGRYSASSEGDIRNNRTKRILIPHLSNTGYLRVDLCKGGEAKTYTIHRLVAEAFHPNHLGLYEVNHKDSDRTNNAADNLEWCTHKQNIEHAARKGNMSRNPSLRANTVTRDGDTRTFHDIWLTLSETERYMLGICLIGRGAASSRMTISNWASGKTQPSKENKTRVTRIMNWAFNSKFYSDTLFPAR